MVIFWMTMAVLNLLKLRVEPSRSLVDRLVSEFGTQVKAIKDANLEKKKDESKSIV
jgi:hypothetical protein